MQEFCRGALFRRVLLFASLLWPKFLKAFADLKKYEVDGRAQVGDCQ